MTDFMKLFKAKPLGTLLRLRIDGQYVEITFDQEEKGIYDVPVFQLEEKLDDYFGVEFFVPDMLTELDSVSIDRGPRIKDANDLSAKHQSVLEFLCELVFICGEEDDINMTREQHKIIRESIVEKGKDGLVPTLITIARNIKPEDADKDSLAFGVFDISDKGDNPLVEWVKEKNILMEIRDISRRLNQGNITTDVINRINDLKNIEQINHRNFPQINEEKAASIRGIIEHIQSLLKTIDHLSVKDQIKCLTALSQRKGLMKEIITKGLGPELIASVDPVQFNVLLKTCREFLDENHFKEFLRPLIERGGEYLARVSYYTDEKIRKDIMRVLLTQKDPFNNLADLYMDKYVNELRLNPYRRDHEDLVRFFLDILRVVVSAGLPAFQQFINRIKQIDYSTELQTRLNNDLSAVILDPERKRTFWSYV